MRRKRERKSEDPELQMTPMIDVVFQLLIFFIFTIRVEDILSHLDVVRPAPDPDAKEERLEELVNIAVYKDGYAFRGRRVSLQGIENMLQNVARHSKNTSIIIRCTGDSPHQHLIEVLNICAREGLRNLSVFSM